MHTIEIRDLQDWSAELQLACGDTRDKGRKRFLVTIRYDMEIGDTFNMYRVDVKNADGVSVGSYGSTDFVQSIETYNKL